MSQEAATDRIFLLEGGASQGQGSVVHVPGGAGYCVITCACSGLLYLRSAAALHLLAAARSAAAVHSAARFSAAARSVCVGAR